MKKEKFEIREKVKVFTSFYNYQSRFWLPNEVLYIGEAKGDGLGYSIILWHGTLHIVPTKDIHKIK